MRQIIVCKFDYQWVPHTSGLIQNLVNSSLSLSLCIYIYIFKQVSLKTEEHCLLFLILFFSRLLVIFQVTGSRS